MKESELPVGDTFRDSLQLRLISSYSSYTNITRQTTSLDHVEGLHISSWSGSPRCLHMYWFASSILDIVQILLLFLCTFNALQGLALISSGLHSSLCNC